MTKVLEEFKMELVMDVAVGRVVDKEVTKLSEVNKELVMDVVVEEVNRELLKEFNEGLVKVYLCKVKKIMLEVVIDVVLDEVVKKEVTKLVEEVNKVLFKEGNEGLVLVCRCGDGRRGDHKVDGGGSGAGQEG